MRASNLFPLLLFQGALLLLVGCADWQHDVVIQNVAFSMERVEDNWLVIGQVKEDTIIGGRPCKHGWVHLRPNGVPVGFTASRKIDLGKFMIPADTWVFQNDNGIVTVCAFPRDTEIQGHMCQGSGDQKVSRLRSIPADRSENTFSARTPSSKGFLAKAVFSTNRLNFTKTVTSKNAFSTKN